MFMGINTKAIEQLDNETNRNIVMENLINMYKEKYNIDNSRMVGSIIVATLRAELAKSPLYNLLLLTAEDCEAILFNVRYNEIVKSVDTKVIGAKEFFRIGSEASLMDDKYYNEYNFLMDEIIPNSAKKLYGMDFEEWRGLIDDVAEYVRQYCDESCKWVGFSNDGSYKMESSRIFGSKEECYNDMRAEVLNKMTWNTEYRADLSDGSAVSYKVWFESELIVHSSYSGVYVYKIVGKDENPTKEDIFNEDMMKFLEGIDMGCSLD